MCREAMPVDGFGNWTSNGRRALLVPDQQALSAQGRVGDFRPSGKYPHWKSVNTTAFSMSYPNWHVIHGHRAVWELCGLHAPQSGQVRSRRF